jgi:Excalibur calcium-binding domain
MNIRLAVFFIFSAFLPIELQAQSCGTKTFCREMESCDEARYFLEQCNLKRLDGDNDGSPCENLCGDGDKQSTIKLSSGGQSPNAIGKQCGSKSKCNQMQSCEEAQFYLTQCGVGRLDRDGDGVPCESICQ